MDRTYLTKVDRSVGSLEPRLPLDRAYSTKDVMQAKALEPELESLDHDSFLDEVLGMAGSSKTDRQVVFAYLELLNF